MFQVVVMQQARMVGMMAMAGMVEDLDVSDWV